MSKVVKGVGGLDHKEWRTYHGLRTGGYKGFVDGDLVEQFLELRRQSQESVAAEMGEGVEDIFRKVEEVRRCCH